MPPLLLLSHGDAPTASNICSGYCCNRYQRRYLLMHYWQMCQKRPTVRNALSNCGKQMQYPSGISNADAFPIFRCRYPTLRRHSGDRREGPKLHHGRGNQVSEDINVLALVKGEEKYIFLFDDKNRAETLRTLGRYASNSELNFSWYDAAVLSQKIRETTKSAATPRFDMPSVTDSMEGDDLIF